MGEKSAFVYNCAKLFVISKCYHFYDCIFNFVSKCFSDLFTMVLFVTNLDMLFICLFCYAWPRVN